MDIYTLSDKMLEIINTIPSDLTKGEVQCNTFYPNLVEEMKQNNHEFMTCAKKANTSLMLFYSALVNGEELKTNELCMIAHYLGCSLGYLIKPKLTLFNPLKRKNDKKLYSELSDKILAVNELKEHADRMNIRIQYWATRHYNDMTEFQRAILSKKGVSYAHYRKALKAVKGTEFHIRSDIAEANRQPFRQLEKEVF